MSGLGRMSAMGSNGGYFIHHPSEGVHSYIGGNRNGETVYSKGPKQGMTITRNGHRSHSLLTPMLKAQKAHQIVVKYAQKRKNQIYNPFSSAGRKFILKQAGFTENDIRNYEKNKSK